jgi:hypothetical protein
MSMKTKTIVVSLAAFLAAVGGIYAFAPGHQGSASGGDEAGDSVQSPKPAATASQDAKSEPLGEKTASQGGDATAKQPAQPAIQVAKKLTREQLMPPPMSEAEKLDKAAQQESNF